ncbi:hypothetical protein SKAU_G00063380 [Synaphobranchus kaupii]|uniref:Polyhomeotic-like protein 3 n=1 Tax=Synaphobranchus kaupii TaxID=118154 RepID=A0A9Q1G593_SYNKA|nr:hypothetical protein SKAU_G00063380 [Synaphobranchus kaupii]
MARDLVALPPTPVTTQPDSCALVSCSTTSRSTISQQAWLLGNSSSSTNQAQMYLHAQMEQNQAQQTNHPAPQDVPPKASAHPRMSLCSPKPTHQSDASKEGLYSPFHSHTLMMHKLRCRLSHKMADHHQLISPMPVGGHRLVQSVSLQAVSQETLPTSQLSASSQTPVTSVSEVQSQHCTATPTLPSASSRSTKQSDVAVLQKTAATSPVVTLSPTSQSPASVVTRPQSLDQSLPSGLTEAPLLQRINPAHKSPSLSPAPSLATSCTGPQSAPLASGTESSPSQPTSPRPLRTLSPEAVQSSAETPATEAVVQVPHQDPPPPQAVTEDLQTCFTSLSDLPKDLSTVYQMVPLHEMGEHVQPVCEDGPGNEEMIELMESPPGVSTCTQILPNLLPPAGLEGDSRNTSTDLTNTAGTGQSSTEPMGDAHTAHSSMEPLHTSSSQAPLPSVRVLTHLIEGFVIQEGLKPFPVNRSSLMVEQRAKLLGAPYEMRGSEVCDPLMDTEQSWNSTDTDLATDDGMDEVLVDVLHCEFCGKRGYAHTFLRSNRFCSTTCVRRFNVSNTKRISTLKASRWPRGKQRRRGRWPSRLAGGSRECFLRQAAQSTGWRPLQAKEEDPPIPITTRLRRQVELEWERERRAREGTDSGGSPPTSPSSPVLWTVDQVCAFVYTLPGVTGCQDIAEEFRSQEIDGQALLLLTEDHLMSTMNIRLGPALKICAQINSLKEP